MVVEVLVVVGALGSCVVVGAYGSRVVLVLLLVVREHHEVLWHLGLVLA